MPSSGRQTICISTQAGCAVDCHFCLTAQLGLIRNLTPAEILAQILIPLEQHKAQLAPQTNLVLMGQGEPLLNFDAVMGALRIILDPEGLALTPKHVTLSTSGIVPGIERLAQGEDLARLAVRGEITGEGLTVVEQAELASKGEDVEGAANLVQRVFQAEP